LPPQHNRRNFGTAPEALAAAACFSGHVIRVGLVRLISVWLAVRWLAGAELVALFGQPATMP
jgi:hypothetical protein